MMTSMMSGLVACVALVGLVGCEAGAPPGGASDTDSILGVGRLISLMGKPL